MHRARTALAASVALLALAACSSASDTAGTDTAGTDTTGDSTTPTQETAATSPTEVTTTSEPTSSAADASTLRGTGYSVSLPDGWEDVTDVAKQSNAAADVALAEPASSTEFRMNFNVVDPNPINAGVSDDELAAQAAKELKSVTQAKVTSISGPDFDGSPSLGQTSQAEASGFTVSLIQFLVRHDDQVYATTMTFETKRTDEAKAVLDEIVASWTWE